MRSLSRKQTVSFVLMIAVFLLACNAIAPAVTSTPAPASPTLPFPVATETSVPALSQQVMLTSIPLNESDPGNGYPNYTITAQTPQLTGSEDPRVLAFNQRLNDLVAMEVNTWRQEFQRLPLTQYSIGSFLNVSYTLAGQRGDVWSFKFDFSFYADMAAHPGLNSTTLNYDLAQGRELALKDLFLPNSEFLEEISYYSMEELKKQPYADSFWLDGAQPVAENYRLWNITPDGLMITFSEYQVAPYAAGPQTVIIPYSELATLIDPQGPLSLFMP